MRERPFARILAARVPMAVLCTLVVLDACDARRSLGSNLGSVAEAGAGGVTGAGGAGGAGDAGGAGGASVGGTGPTLPKAMETCPPMAGLAGTNVTFLGSAVTLWSGPSGSVGPMVFYWHATTATSDEAVSGLGPGTREVVNSGGVIASFNDSNGTGTNTGDFTWYTGDFNTADEILACAIQQGLIDVTHIHSAGYSPGSCQTAAMVYARAYLASILCYSGGSNAPSTSLPDPKNHPAMLGAHGAVGSDVFGIDIAVNTILLENDLKSKGSFVIDCDDGGDHSIGTRMTGAAGPGWQFFKDHPYKVDPEPYKSLPATFPAYCKLM